MTLNFQKTGFGRSTPIALNMVEDIENEWIRIGLKEDLKPNTEYILDTEYIGFLKESGYAKNHHEIEHTVILTCLFYSNVYGF